MHRTTHLLPSLNSLQVKIVPSLISLSDFLSLEGNKAKTVIFWATEKTQSQNFLSPEDHVTAGVYMGL